ncbi:MAG: TRAP-type mannitol/chloroaromatic compound transport system permease small subunit [Gammaproteobacteria bacterium]|jgi:TRAP-type mannitol/chloroaromatic compound transport system permease small subunit
MTNVTEIEKLTPHGEEIVESIDDHEMVFRESSITRFIDRFIMGIGEVFNWIWLLLLFVIIGNVVLRYVFSQGMIELEELQWHLFAIGWLIGLSTTFILDGHVRVDVIHERLNYQTKLKLELFGLLVFFLPFVCFAMIYAIPFVELSWFSNERSTSANGLPARWIVKGFLLFSLMLLNLAAVSRLIKVILSLKNGRPPRENNPVVAEQEASHGI